VKRFVFFLLILNLFSSVYASNIDCIIGKKLEITKEEIEAAKSMLPSFLVVPDNELERVALQNRLFSKEYLSKRKLSEKEKAEVILEVEKYLSAKYQKELIDAVVTDEKVLKSYYLDNKDEFVLPPKITARDIVVEKADKADEAYYKVMAEKIDFDKIAREYSEDMFASKGGLLPAAPISEFTYPLKSWLETAKVGDISTPIKVFEKFHILKVEKIEEQSTKYEDIKDIIRERLIAKIKTETLKTDAERLKKKFTSGK